MPMLLKTTLRIAIIATVLLILAMSGDVRPADAQEYPVGTSGQAIPVSSSQTVVASYYGYELAGNLTASGEVFDPLALTAASPYLPFGTVLEVCYLSCTNVVVNDRGPYVAGRGLDVSLGAARAIGLEAVGVAPVSVRVI